MTERVRDLLRERFVFDERGRVEVKGMGEVLTYLLVGGRSQDPASAGSKRLPDAARR